MTQTKFRITPIYDVLLRGSPHMPMGLYHLHTATAEQLCRLHYKAGCIKAVKASLKDLAEAGYVQHDVIPSKELVTIAFTTFEGDVRLAQMRRWAKQELATYDAAIGQSFLFASLTKPLEPRTVWLEPCWQTPFDGEPQALLGAVQ